MTLPNDVFTIAQIREIEHAAQTTLHMTEDALMQCAGAAALSTLQAHWPGARRIAIICGQGNNGGDGYVLGRLAFAHDLDVVIWQVGDSANLTGAAHKAAQACYQADIPVKDMEAFHDHGVDVIVDAVLGIGAAGEVRGEAKAAIHALNQTVVPVLSLDIPSGLEANTGSVLGEAVCADATVAFVGLKQGMLTHAGVDYCGTIYCDQLQIPTQIFDAVLPEIERVSYEAYQPVFLPRRRDTHKGAFGHVLIIGGAPGYSGAVRIAAEAAMRVGAGRVSVAYHQQPANVLDARSPEIMAHAVSTAADVQPLIDAADVLVVGPGLGQLPWSRDLFDAALSSGKPLLIDADGLNLLAQTPKALHDQVIMTPHPGEAARLLGISVAEVQDDRFSAIRSLHDQYQANCVLKGAGSIMIDHSAVASICTDGNPGMASAGMGDLLSGIIAGLMAQHFSVDLALRVGVCLHAKAGDMAAQRVGERGVLAMDLIPEIQQLINVEDHAVIPSK